MVEQKKEPCPYGTENLHFMRYFALIQLFVQPFFHSHLEGDLGEGTYLMIMQDGGITLRSCVNDDKLPNGKASLTICEHTNKGLAYLHYYSSDSEKSQIIHRDLKYDNILVNINQDEVIAKIIDFGIARDNYAAINDKTRTSTARNVLGAKMFLSPETLEYVRNKTPIPPRVYSPKMDIYGSGINFIFSYTGRLPYLNNPYSKIVDKTIPVLPKGTPNEIVNLISRMLHVQPEMRPNAEEAASCMEQFKKDDKLIQKIEKVWSERKGITGEFNYKKFEEVYVEEDNHLEIAEGKVEELTNEIHELNQDLEKSKDDTQKTTEIVENLKKQLEASKNENQSLKKQLEDAKTTEKSNQDQNTSQIQTELIMKEYNNKNFIKYLNDNKPIGRRGD